MSRTKTTSAIAVVQAANNVKDFIDKHPLIRKSTDEFACEQGVNRSLLQKAFKSAFKKTIKDYQFESRMEAACELLREGRLIIKEVSQECGYDNPNNFSNAFKKKYKLSPSQWQKANCTAGLCD